MVRRMGVLGLVSLFLPWTFAFDQTTQYFEVDWLLFAYISSYGHGRFTIPHIAAISGIVFILVLIGSILLITGHSPKAGSCLILLGILAIIFTIFYYNLFILTTGISIGLFLALIVGIKGLTIKITPTLPIAPSIPAAKLEVKPVVEKPLVEVKPPPSPELVNIVDEVGRVVGEVERYEGYLNELERRRGELSGDVYVRLKSMYEGEVAQRKSRIEDLTNKAVKMGAWKCLRCGMVNLPSINICRKCGWKQQ